MMRVKASGPKRSLYWRATTLDDYTGDIWDEAKDFGDAEQREQIDAIGENSLLPPAADNEERLDSAGHHDRGPARHAPARLGPARPLAPGDGGARGRRRR